MSVYIESWMCRNPILCKARTDEEPQPHIREAIARSRDATEARTALGPALGHREESRDVRPIDALLLRPLPVAEPDRLYALSYDGIGNDGKPRIFDGCEYPMFRHMRAAAKDQAGLLAVSFARRADLTYGSDNDSRRAADGACFVRS